MRDLAVVALEEVLADDLPVRVDLGFPAPVEDELVDVEPELCDLGRHRAERLCERFGLALCVDEEERAPRVDGDAAEAELARREVGELLRARRAPKRAVEPVRPRVVGALDRLALARALCDREAAVPADVEEGAELAIACACDDDRRAAGARGRVRAGLRQLAEMPRVLPRSAEDALLLAPRISGSLYQLYGSVFSTWRMYRAVRWAYGRNAARLCLHQGASEGLHRRASGRSGGFPRLHRLGAARLLQGRRRRPPQC